MEPFFRIGLQMATKIRPVLLFTPPGILSSVQLGDNALDGTLATLMGYLRSQQQASPPAHEIKSSAEKPDKKSQDKI